MGKNFPVGVDLPDTKKDILAMLGGMWHRLGQNPRKFFSSISCLSILCKSEDLELHFHHQHGGNKSNLQFLLSELKCIKNLNRSSDD